MNILFIEIHYALFFMEEDQQEYICPLSHFVKYSISSQVRENFSAFQC